MSYSLSVSGHVDSKRQEAEVLQAAVELADKVGALGSFSFSGSHFQVWASAPEDAIAKAKEVLAAYNAEADADDQVAGVDSDAGEPDPEDTEA
ncbi:MAG TPA: hypothetical protein VFI34_07585 [Candidatus Limnocylindrales bacterium]|nr:hypothetical protein [Candidatus Limnocylindrales bacterium]